MEIKGLKYARSFGGKPEYNRKLGKFLIVACTILSLCILSLVKAKYCPAPYVKTQAPMKLQASEKSEEKMVTEKITEDPSFQEDEDDDDEEVPKPAILKPKPICYESSKRSDTCEAEGDIRIQPKTRTIFINTSPPSTQEFKIRPYTRKSDPGALAHVEEWSIKPFSDNPPQCTSSFSSPAVVFSIGGFTGNLFHDYTDVLVPLYITARKFHGDVHLLVTDTKPWWVSRFSRVLKQLSSYAAVDLESSQEPDRVLCYPKTVAGPIFHNELGVDKAKANNLSMAEFKGLVRGAFGLEREAAMTGSLQAKPRLLVMSRKRSRAFMNLKGIVAMAESLGFDVRVGEPDLNTDVAKFARLVNSADVLIGVHGAGLTNMVYLPEGAVVIQVVPLGGLEWLARDTFEVPSEDMGLRYLKYVITEEESTLIDVYPRDHEVIRDPVSVHKKGWMALREVYLDKQNVRVHLGRLRSTLLEALKLLPHRN